MRAGAFVVQPHPTCRALVIVRTLLLTNPGPPSSQAASPNMYKSVTAPLAPDMAMIFTTHFISSSLLTLTRAQSTVPAPLDVVLVLLLTSPVSVLVRPNDDVRLAASNDVSHLVSRLPHAEVAVRHVKRSHWWNRYRVQWVVLDIRDSHGFLAGPIQCLLRGDSYRMALRGRLPWHPPRYVLTHNGWLLIPCFPWFSLDPPSAVRFWWVRVPCASFICVHPLHRYVITSVIAAAPLDHTLCEFWSRPSRHVTRVGVVCSPCGGAGSYAWCGWSSMQDRGAWCRFLLCVQCNLVWGFRLGMTGGTGPLQYASHSRILGCVPLHCVRQFAIDSFVSRSQSCGSHSLPSTGLRSSSGVLHCALVVSPGQFSDTGTQDNLRWDPTARSLPCEGRSSQLRFPSALLLGLGTPSQRVSPFQLGVERIVTAIWWPGSGPHLESSVSVPFLRLGYSPDVRRTCPGRQSLLGGNHCLWRRVQHANKHSWVDRCSHFPPLAGLAGMKRIFSPNSRIGVLSLRPCCLCNGVFPSLPMSHLFTKYAANSTNQHNILASGGTLAPVRCSSAAFSVLAWPATRPTARSMIPLAWICPTSLRVDQWTSLLSLRSKETPFLSRNQHGPCHLVSPFPDDHHRTHTILGFHVSKKPIVHWHVRHSLQVVLSIGSPVRRVHTAPHHTEFPPWSVGSMCGHVFLMFLGGWLSCSKDVSQLCAPVIESHLSVLHVLVVCLTVQLVSILNVRRTQHTVTFSSFFAVLTQLRSYGFSSLLPRALLLPSKSWAVAVERDSPSWPSSICDVIDYTMGAATLDGTLTNRSSTYTFPLSIDFSLLFLFMMYASSFRMNKSFLAWMMCDADTRGLLTSATCHVLLRTNPSRGPDGHDLLSVVLDVLSTWSLESFSILGPLCLPDPHLEKHAPRKCVCKCASSCKCV